LTASGGMIGVLMLVVSFLVNPGPPTDATPAQLLAFAQANYGSILWGAWLQAVGPVLIVAFAFAIVSEAGLLNSFSGIMTVFGGAVLTMVSLTEIAFYISAVGDPSSAGTVSLDLIHSVQHLYFMVGAPALLLPLGAVVVASGRMPKVLGFSAMALGASFAVVGVAFLFDFVLPTYVTAFAGIQVVWWLAAGTVFVSRPKGTPGS